MNSTPEAIVKGYLEELLQDNEEVFLVEYSLKPGNNIKIYLDGDHGITIDNCIRINRALYKRIEEAAIFPEGDFAIEVSSPGVDQPLKLHRQYRKNIGRTVEVILLDSLRKEGKLTEATETGITIEEKQGSGKKAIVKMTVIPLDQVKHCKVMITF